MINKDHQIQRGRGPWKLNPESLEDKEFITQLENELEKVQEENPIESLKKRKEIIITTAKKWTVKQAKKRKTKEKALKRKILVINQEIQNNTANPSRIRTRDEAEKVLGQWINKNFDLEKTISMGRFKEKSSRYFYQAGKLKTKKQPIKGLRNEQDVYCTREASKRKVAENYYEKLMSKGITMPLAQSEMVSHIKVCITEESQNKITEEITEVELEDHLAKCKNDRAA
ncbi:LINE-1 reverse transcriptase, partial [Neolecta irregularis DAH-3]